MCSENRPFYLLPTEGVELLDFPVTFRRSFRSPAATTFAGRAVTAATPVADGLTTPAAVAAETSVLETEAASHPCSIGLNGTCKDEEDSTCYMFNPYFPGPPEKQSM